MDRTAAEISVVSIPSMTDIKTSSWMLEIDNEKMVKKQDEWTIKAVKSGITGMSAYDEDAEDLWVNYTSLLVDGTRTYYKESEYYIFGDKSAVLINPDVRDNNGKVVSSIKIDSKFKAKKSKTLNPAYAGKTYTVKEIYPWALCYGKEMKKVKKIYVPSTVKKIGEEGIGYYSDDAKDKNVKKILAVVLCLMTAVAFMLFTL